MRPEWWHNRLVLHLQDRQIIWAPVHVLAALLPDPGSFLWSGKAAEYKPGPWAAEPRWRPGRTSWPLASPALAITAIWEWESFPYFPFSL